ncbi:hypothetical protein FVR03_17220 [Pontibacter qinzhouensis]|uniref:Translocation/assembly module TamB n=1 Tax=Pontibacter qinzhouensis TaxID=2603253 RepID=A0A5C8JJ02_9BACT|nr:hypothetical protein [Pontibacter qinzhouensis]TXK36674.1 hypothetical protein FVR03_17220 [Pontibacter qinzhouensis]
MKQFLLPFFLLLTFFASQALAQTKLSENPAEFVTDAKALLLSGKGPNAQMLASNLEELWSSGKLTAKQQQEIVSIAQQLYKKKMRVRPHFEQFFGMVTDGVSKHNLRGSSLDNMLEVVAKAVKQEETANLERFLATSSLYLASNMLFQNKFQKLKATGGRFSFVYEGGPAAKLSAKDTGSSNEWETISWDDDVAASETTEDDPWGTVAVTPVKPAASKKEQAQQAKQRFIPAQPKVTGPALKLENVALTFITPHDSVAIGHTSGHVVLAHQLFVGEGGSYEWQVNGNPASAIFRQYSFSLAAPAFKVPDATLSYPSILQDKIEGAFEFKSIKRSSKGETGYPKFISFTDDAKLKNLDQNMQYRGGFSLAGNLIGSSCLDGKSSEIIVSYNGTRKFRSASKGFSISDSLLTATRASVEIFQGKDLLTHPAMQLVYSRPANTLTLTREKGTHSNTPFLDNYHQMEIMAERLHWNLATPDIDFVTVRDKMLVPVRLESTAYYSNSQYQQLVGVATFHPLKPLVSYATKYKTNEFNVSDVAKFTKLSEEGFRDAAIRLSQLGFVDYDAPSGHLVLKQKAWHYVGASQHQHDYDHLVIKSLVPSGRNATLNLETNKLQVRGVRKVFFSSDTTSIYIVPDSSTITILSNRDMEFSGEVYANQLAFKGSEFKFDYNEFSIDLQKLKYMSLNADEKDPKKNSKSKSINKIVPGSSGKFSGKVYINRPNNKSGKDRLSDYPKFDALTGGQLSFSSPDILGGAYDSTVYFEMYPFKVDSLSNSRRGVVGFQGKFHSGGLMPAFETKVVMMPDGVMGFNHKAPVAGIPVFGGKGVAYDSVVMNAGGLQSKGKLKYLTATLEAPTFTFFQDSVLAPNGTAVTIAEPKAGEADLPGATLAAYNMRWLPKADTMYLQMVQEPLKLYQEPFMFKGIAKLSPGGLYGSGKLDAEASRVVSEHFQFNQRSFSAKNGQLVLKSDTEEKPALNARQVHINYALTKGVVDFETVQKGTASLEFPKAQYKTSLSSGSWDIAKQQVTLKATEAGAHNLFYSLHPGQSGLRFTAAGGQYDLSGNTLRAIGVPHIAVADSYIVPDSGKVEITTGAVIKPLQNAAIMADSLHQFHKMHAGNINILSRHAFTGEALYTYQGASEEPYELRFSDFAYGSGAAAAIGKKKVTLYTSAVATVDEAKPFPVFPSILYRGKVAMHSSQKYMNFDGYLKLNFTGRESDFDWFPFKRDSLNPEKVLIPLVNPKTADGVPLRTGLHVTADSARIYNTFVSKKHEQEDLDLFTVDGLLSYNKEKNEFEVGDPKIQNNASSYEGNLLRFNPESNKVNFKGKINLLQSTKNFGIEATGAGNANIDSSLYLLNAFMAFDLNVPAQALAIMAKGLKANIEGLPGAVTPDDRTLAKIADFLSNREANKYKEQSADKYMPLTSLSSKLARSLLLNNVDLKWSDEKKAWYSVGKLSLAGILKEDINAQLDGYLEVRQEYGKPVVNLYMQADTYNWYYFSFVENGLILDSSDDKFNHVIRSKSKGSRELSIANYGFFVAQPAERTDFVAYFRKSYLNGKEDFKLSSTARSFDNAAPVGYDYDEEQDGGKKKKKKNKKDESEEEFN